MTIVNESLVLSLEHAGTLMTPDEFDAVVDADDNYIYELVQGVLVVCPIPDAMIRAADGLLGYLVRQYAEHQSSNSSFDYTIGGQAICTPHSRRRADRVIWAGVGRTPNVCRDVPAIAIEFVSVGKRNRVRDYEHKRDEYLAAGVQEYWVIDRFRRQMTVFRRDATAIAQVVIAEGESYATPLLPGFELPLTRVLAEADKLAAAQDDTQ